MKSVELIGLTDITQHKVTLSNESLFSLRLLKKWQLLGKNKILTGAYTLVREDQNFVFNDADATFSAVSSEDLQFLSILT